MYKYLLLSLLFLSCAAAPKTVLVADLDPLSAGFIDLGVQAYFPSRIKQISAPLTFDPRKDTVYLEFMYETVTYRQYWDSPNRERFIAAVKQYQADFDSQKLNSGNRSRTRAVYGRFKGITEWGTLGFLNANFLINSLAYPRMELGYTFYHNSPYFLITQNSAENISPSSHRNNSLRIELFLTRAMAEDMAEAFEQSRLLSYLPADLPDQFLPGEGGRAKSTAVQGDAY